MLYTHMSTNPSSLSQCYQWYTVNSLPLILQNTASIGSHCSQRQKSRGIHEPSSNKLRRHVCDTFFPIFPPWMTFSRVGKESPIATTTSTCSSTTQAFPFEQRVTKDGFPETGCCNYFAPWLLTRADGCSNHRSGHSRRPTVASRASNRALQLYPSISPNTTPFLCVAHFQYMEEQLLNIMFTTIWRESTPIRTSHSTPSARIYLTGLGRELPSHAFLHYAITSPDWVTDSRSRIIVYIAIDPRWRAKTGGFYSEKQELLTPVAQATAVELQRCCGRQRKVLEHGWKPVSITYHGG